MSLDIFAENKNDVYLQRIKRWFIDTQQQTTNQRITSFFLSFGSISIYRKPTVILGLYYHNLLTNHLYNTYFTLA